MTMHVQVHTQSLAEGRAKQHALNVGRVEGPRREVLDLREELKEMIPVETNGCVLMSAARLRELGVDGDGSLIPD